MTVSKIPITFVQSQAEIGSSSYTAQITYSVKRLTKINNYVHAELVFNTTNSKDIPANTNIGNIPAGYRPPNNINLPAIIKTDSGIICGTVMFGANGQIDQGLTGHCRGAYVDAWYKL